MMTMTMMMIVLTAVISIALYITDNGEHTVLCRIGNNMYGLKISKILLI